MELQQSSQNLCQRCSGVSFGGITHDYFLHPGFESLITSSASCSLCRIVMQSLRSTIKQWIERGQEPSEKTVSLHRHETPGKLWIRALGLKLGELHFYAHPAVLAAELRLPLAFLDVEQFTHPLLAATWQDCIHGRGRCQMSSTGQISTKPLLPKRVLDLGDSTSTELTTSVRLHESVAGERSDYVALSHRWGENIPSKTTTINLDMYKRGVIYSDLPCTFKDAIDTSRNMGIRYVWIDALCIVQDDHDDWASQAPLMGTIFQNATCTIAAHSAEHSDYGFLSIAKGTKMVEVGSEYQQSQSQSAVDKIYLELPRNFDGFISRSHITQRGWVQQELILSRRLMHFFNGLVFWECDHLASPEPLGFTAELHTFRDLQTYRKRTLRTLENNPGGSWLDFVTHYSACELTYPSDRLVAIDGIAREWMDRMGTTVAQHYRYGHFLHNASSLLWVAENVVISKRRHVPSWSWASMEGSVQFMRSQPIGLISHLQSMSFQVNASIKYAQTSRPDRKDQVVISTQVTALDVSCPKNTQRHSHYWHNIWDQGNPKGYPLHLPHDATCFFDHPPDNIRAGKTNAKNNYRNEFELYFNVDAPDPRSSEGLESASSSEARHLDPVGSTRRKPLKL